MKKKITRKYLYLGIVIIILIGLLLIFNTNQIIQDCNVKLEGFLAQPIVSAPPILTEFNTSDNYPCLLDIYLLESKTKPAKTITKTSSCFLKSDEVPFFDEMKKVIMKGKYIETTVCHLLSKQAPAPYECNEEKIFLPCEVIVVE